MFLYCSTVLFEQMKVMLHRVKRVFLQYHPDRLGDDLSAETESAVCRFVEVNSAWKVLGEQNTRRQYDSQRRGELYIFHFMFCVLFLSCWF